MEYIIIFFRDILDGPLYIIFAIISGILICSCIGYLAEQSENKKRKIEEKENKYADVSNQNTTSVQTGQSINSNVVNTVQNVQSGVNNDAIVQNTYTTEQNSIPQNIPQNVISQNLQSTVQQTPKM